MRDAVQRTAAGQLSFPRVPAVAWLLLGMAGVHVVVELFGRGVLGTATYQMLTVGLVLSLLLDAMPFVLAAAVLSGAPAWPRGRRWLLGGVALFAATGLANLGTWAWFWANTEPAGLLFTPDDLVWQMTAAWVGTALAACAALPVAVGLWSSRPASLAPDWRRRLMAGIAVAAVIGAAEYVATIPLVTTGSNGSLGAVAAEAFSALGILSTACVGLAALAIMPSVGWLPERMIGIGAAIAVLGRALMGLIEVTSSTTAVSPLFGLYGWMADLQLVGLVAVAGGLALGRLVAPRPREGIGA